MRTVSSINNYIVILNSHLILKIGLIVSGDKAFKRFPVAHLPRCNMEEKRCVVEFLPDKKFGWKIKPVEGCESVFKEIAENQGPYAKRYLDDRKIDGQNKNAYEQPHQSTE